MPSENKVPTLQRILALNIKTARKKLEYTQQRLAEEADISPGHMNDVEQAKKWVSPETLQRIADALGLEPFMLLLPRDYSSELDAFTLLTEYASSVRERIDGALESSLREILKRREKEEEE